jgi:hypothetical protein
MKKRGKPTKGRPRKPPDKVKEKLLQVRLSAAEKRVFVEVAELTGFALSVWIRDQLRRAARQVFAEFGKTDPFMAGISDKGSLK